MLLRRLLASTPIPRPLPTFISYTRQLPRTRTMASSSLPKVKPYSQGQAKIRKSEPMKEGKVCWRPGTSLLSSFSAILNGFVLAS